MRRLVSAVTLCLAAAACSAETPHLLRHPSLSDTAIAFRYADDIWTVPRAGGMARRLTSTANIAEGPFVSPDGRTVAYSARVNGNIDVFTVPAAGGVARRITFQPDGNYVAGWTPDGKDLLVAGMEKAHRMFFQMYRVHADGSGLPQMLPLPSAAEASYSPDGSHIAYNPFLQWQEASWKRYRGGQTQPVWIVDAKTLDVVKVPRENSNDRYPQWDGDTVYFLSDRNGAQTLFRYDVKARDVKQLVANKGLDIKSYSVHKGVVVYEQFGALHLLENDKDTALTVQLDGDLPALQPHIAKVAADEIQNANISPTGVRAVFEAHGEIFTVPADKGDTRNLTNTTDAAEREPSWSDDGMRLAYFSDAGGEYKLVIRNQSGAGTAKRIDLGPNPTYYYGSRWSPDSKRVLFTDKRGDLWYVNVDDAAPRPVKIDLDDHGPWGPNGFAASFSADSRWVLYLKSLPSMMNAAYLFNTDTGKSTQVTDGMSNVTNPVWDQNGKYIFFTASTDVGPAVDGFGLGSFNRTTTSSVYVAVLSKSDPSPIPPESDDEKAKSATDEAKPAATDAAKSEEKKPGDTKSDAAKAEGEKKDAKKLTKIDLDGMGERILALPVPARNYTSMYPGKTGVLLLGEASSAAANSSAEGPSGMRSIWRFTLETRKTEDVLHGSTSMVASADGEKLLYRKGDGFFIAPIADLKPEAADGTPGKSLKMDGMQARVDPRAEWKQIYNETWRIEREFFYDPNFHGLDLKKISAKYAPYVDGLSTRSDLTYLQQEMLGELTVGHMFISGPHTGGDGPKAGMLGADYTIDQDRYRIAHVVHGGNWNPALYAPLTQPGVNVKDGEYLLAVNGTPLHATDDVYEAFDGLAGKQTTITVGPTPDGKGSRDVLVLPVASERAMREQEWIEGNIRKVDAMSNGQVAYVYVPNTAGAGFDSFNRYFFAQTGKKAVVIDERFNQGGDIADYVIDVLKRKPMLNYVSREGVSVTEPSGAIFGPKAMLINQNAGSGGDAMPWLFRQAQLGPLVGTRTWGGLVGIGGYPSLLDGGSVTAPRTALYGLNGQWEVENIGVAPDVMVEDDPRSAAAGHDAQLEKAVSIVMDELKKNPPATFRKPAYPNYHKDDGLGR